MFKTVLIFCSALVGLIAAEDSPDDEGCSPADAQSVQEEWNSLWANNENVFKVEFAKSVILRTVAWHPEARDLFKNAGIDDPSSAKFSAHALRIFNSLDLLINSLRDRSVLREASVHLGRQHRQRPGVLRKYFWSFEIILLLDIIQVTDSRHVMAWTKCLQQAVAEVTHVLPISA